MLFAIGDYLAGILIGIVTALLVRIVVWPGMDMVIAMLLGTALGMAVHLFLGLILSPLLGMFETMVSASLVGMYGGMLNPAMPQYAGNTRAATPMGRLCGIYPAADKIHD